MLHRLIKQLEHRYGSKWTRHTGNTSGHDGDGNPRHDLEEIVRARDKRKSVSQRYTTDPCIYGAERT